MNGMATASEATWIWYPGDFEVWLGNIFNNRRTERGAFFPPFWKQDSHWPTVVFTVTVDLQDAEDILVVAEGIHHLSVDGRLQTACTIPAGRHRLAIKVWNQVTPPAIFVSGPTIHSDASWLVTYEDKIWIDERGEAHGSGQYVPVGCWNFNSAATPPSAYRLARRRQWPVSVENDLYDFGRETFGYLRLKELRGTVHVYYGESAEEARDKAHCETLDVVHKGETPESKAFRYVMIEKEAGARFDDVSMDYEYAPFDAAHSGSFRCSDNLLNRIWDVSAYTLDLTTREFFLDGIKRDRWTWSGDAIQSYLMNYYLRFDTECVKRTIRQLRGKDPVTAHVNTIMDYTFFWFKSILDYYDYTADVTFIREMWPRMVTLMDYVLSRTDGDGMAAGQSDDWLFVDWTDFPMHKRGTLCFEQILFCKALQTMQCCADLLGISGDYGRRADSLRQQINSTFWSEEQQAYLHAVEDGQLNPQITKFPNMMAIIYGLCSEQQCRQITDRVLLNPSIDPITTPYMRFYELEALCMMGRQEQVLREMRSYWGGMLRQGATTFWEKYNPDETGTQHLAMYGRPYGKSLCHAWGASPLYLLGRYFLGVRPTQPGYEAYEVHPRLGGLRWLEGDVPTPWGTIHVYADKDTVRVSDSRGKNESYPYSK